MCRIIKCLILFIYMCSCLVNSSLVFLFSDPKFQRYLQQCCPILHSDTIWMGTGIQIFRIHWTATQGRRRYGYGDGD
ncbi:hypothetical protein ACS0TY_026989 [Phlomoides rotata]